MFLSLALLVMVSCTKSSEQEVLPDKTFTDGHPERFARDMAYADHREGDILACETDGNYTVIKVFDHWESDGSYATAFLSAKDNHILSAFRGTGSLATLLRETMSLS